LKDLPSLTHDLTAELQSNFHSMSDPLCFHVIVRATLTVRAVEACGNPKAVYADSFGVISSRLHIFLATL
jgi:hypothetical protein